MRRINGINSLAAAAREVISDEGGSITAFHSSIRAAMGASSFLERRRCHRNCPALSPFACWVGVMPMAVNLSLMSATAAADCLLTCEQTELMARCPFFLEEEPPVTGTAATATATAPAPPAAAGTTGASASSKIQVRVRASCSGVMEYMSRVPAPRWVILPWIAMAASHKSG